MRCALPAAPQSRGSIIKGAAATSQAPVHASTCHAPFSMAAARHPVDAVACEAWRGAERSRAAAVRLGRLVALGDRRAQLLAQLHDAALAFLPLLQRRLPRRTQRLQAVADVAHAVLLAAQRLLIRLRPPPVRGQWAQKALPSLCRNHDACSCNANPAKPANSAETLAFGAAAANSAETMTHEAGVRDESLNHPGMGKECHKKHP
jgi:hypothetical protein